MSNFELILGGIGLTYAGLLLGMVLDSKLRKWSKHD